ncbi:MAG: Uma2 family endonuclease [Akkermansiaceae bacterium]|jgi:Uma2 family endonuclease
MTLEETDLISEKDYLAGELVSDLKHEYLGGIVHAMAGGKIRHNRAVGNVFGSLFGQLRGKGCEPFNSDTKVRIVLPAQARFYYPDMQVVCESTGDDESFQDKPVVVVEVLSRSTRRVDLGEKRDAYLAVPSLRVLVIVDPTRLWVQVDRRGETGGFTQKTYRELADVISLPEVEGELKVGEIYEGIGLD